MAHIGRSVKNVEAPRPLKSQSRSSLKNNYMLIEELIQLIENVAITLQSGNNNAEPMATLVQNLRIHGPQLESVSKDTLDRAFVVFRNASQDERLNIMTRLNLLELIELRAKGWEDSGINSYYKTKQATNADLNDVQNHFDPTQTAFLSTSPTFGVINAGGNAAAAAAAAAIASVGSANQQHLLLSPGEVIRNSGKFPKPTKIPGKTYCKDEVVIRNADSGKVMGIKGRRVHMIEELSETIISFQRVNPGAKERLVQITGPAEDKINYAKQLIEDTIRRNASPVRLDPAMVSSHAGAGGSCSSLASSNSDEAVQSRTPGASNLSNRLSFNSAQNFMTAAAAASQQQMVQHQQQHMANIQAMNTSTPVANAAVAAAAGEYKFTCNVGQHVIKITGDCCELVRIAKLVLDDHFSSADFLASIEAGAAFDGSMTSPISTPTTNMTGAPQFAIGTSLHTALPMATDSGIGLNYMSSVNSNNNQDIDDDVFVDSNNLSKSASQSNGLARSRRSHFSRKDSTPEAASSTTHLVITRQKSESGNNSAKISETTRIVHQYEHLLFYAKSPHSWALPSEWQKICEKFPAIVRNKVTASTTTHDSAVITTSSTTTTTLSPITYPSYSSNTTNSTKASFFMLRVACNNAAPTTSCIQNMTTTTTSTSNNTNINATTNSSLVKALNSNSNSNLTNVTHNTIPQITTRSSSINNVTNISFANSNSKSSNVNNNLSYSFNNQSNNCNYYNQAYYNETKNINSNKLQETSNNSLNYKPNSNANLSLNIKRKGFFNRLSYSIDEDGYEASMKSSSLVIDLPPPQFSTANTSIIHNTTHITSNGIAGSGRINSAGLNRHITSIPSGPMSAVPLTSVTNIEYLSPNEAVAHTHQKLLHKQIKIISDIMVESSKNGTTHKSHENLKSNSDSLHNQKNSSDSCGTGCDTGLDNDDDDDDDDDIEIVAISTAITPTAVVDKENEKSISTLGVRPKLTYDFRSYSTCD